MGEEAEREGEKERGRGDAEGRLTRGKKEDMKKVRGGGYGGEGGRCT